MKDIVATFYKNSTQIKVIFVNQNWDLPFNKGAMLNIGFLEIKKLYPNSYENITFVFHDVDVIPFQNVTNRILLNHFCTTSGTVKHIFGFKHSLGGIFSITGLDFNKVAGFPNIYGWNTEDIIFQERVVLLKLTIDRSESHFTDADTVNRSNNRVINLSNSVPLQEEFRTSFVSESERNTDADNFDSLISYEVEKKRYDIDVLTFKTIHEVRLENNNLKVHSRKPLPRNLVLSGKKANISEGDGWFMNHWSEKLHGKQWERK
jgi:hypothetical protein